MNDNADDLYPEMDDLMLQLIEEAKNKEQMYLAYQMIVAKMVKSTGGSMVFNLDDIYKAVEGNSLAAKLDQKTMTLTVTLTELPDDQNLPEPTVGGNQTKH